MQFYIFSLTIDPVSCPNIWNQKNWPTPLIGQLRSSPPRRHMSTPLLPPPAPRLPFLRPPMGPGSPLRTRKRRRTYRRLARRLPRPKPRRRRRDKGNSVKGGTRVTKSAMTWSRCYLWCRQCSAFKSTPKSASPLPGADAVYVPPCTAINYDRLKI